MIRPATKEAYQLLHAGSLALAEVERAGIRIDTGYLEDTTKQVAADVEALRRKLRGDKVFAAWRKRFGLKANLGSRPQLAEVLFGVLGHPYPGGEDNLTTTKKWKADEEVLAAVKEPFVADYLRMHKLEKLRGTYLAGIAREVQDGYLHPSFNLNTVKTYRSSSSDPNFQNVPIRDAEIGALIRKAFIPRKGRALVEMDYGGIEVRISCCYHRDPTLIRYVEDLTTDMHRDMAMELFLLSQDQVEKRTTRDWAKNRFVFPQFYGSVFFQCAPALWQGVLSGATLPNGMTVRRHLKEQGIRKLGQKVSHWKTPVVGRTGRIETEPGTFMDHVRLVQDRMWKERFPVYTRWKNDWYACYLRRGWFRLKTGFVEQGLYGRNDVTNHPIQGSAFHCLLLALTEVARRLRKHKLRARVVGQIHDSMLLDVPERELQDVLTLCREVMEDWVPRQWPWIIVPLETETDVAFDNWHGKKTWKETAGVWGPAA